MKRTTIILMVSYLYTVLAVFFISCSSPPQTPEEIVKAYIDAHNRQDVDKAMSFLSDDIQFEMGSGWVCYGKDQIRQLIEWDSAVGGTLNIRELEARGDTVSCKLTEQSDWFRLIGIDTVYYDLTQFYFQEDSIIAFRAIINNKSALMIQDVFISLRNWAKAKRPEALEKLMPRGDFIYDAALAEPWLALLREWRQATGQE